MNKLDKIYIAGHNGMVGSAINRLFKEKGYENIIIRGSDELDLTNQQKVLEFFENERPDIVILAAAKVGGIYANNTYPAEFIYENIMIQTNVINAAYDNHVKKLLFLGSSCVYPKNSKLPIKEEELLKSELEKTNEAYAIAKISGLKMIEFYNRQYNTNYISLMPTNLYGKNDNYHHENSHAMAALIKKFVDAKINGEENVIIWGTGEPLREFLYVDDFAEAVFHILKNNEIEYRMLNIGYGEEISVKELGKLIAKIIGYEGRISYDTSKPDGTFSKIMDNSKIMSLGWSPQTSIYDGIRKTVNHYSKKFYGKELL